MAIEIATAEDFMNINNDLFADYIQVADIDLAGYDFEPLGDPSVIGLPFLGTYDGQGYTIRNITINTEKSQAGIFALKYGGFLRNMIIENVNITAKNGSGVGALVGFTDALIENILLRNITITGNYNIGGLAGSTYGTVKKVAIVGVNLTGQGLVGGLIGENNGTIQDCFATDGSAINISDDWTSVGGLVGRNNYGTIQNCYSTIYVTRTSQWEGYPGGLVGENNYGAVIDSYYDLETSGQSDTGKGEPKTTEQMKQQETYENWDFINIWDIDSKINGGYPYLIAFAKEFAPGEPDPGEQPEKVILYFIDIPQVNIQSPTANVVTVFSPTAEYTAAIPGISEDEKVERIVEIEEGNGQVCRIIANELLKRWSKEQKSITGPVQLCLGLEFQQKVRVINKEAMLDEYMPVQKLEHDIINQITRVTAGDLILSDEELLARILEKL